MNDEQAAEAIRCSTFAEHSDTLIPLLQPAIRLISMPARELRKGQSRFYGPADVPAGFCWPRTRSGVPLELLAQIDLAAVCEIFHSQLPATGWLYFFFDRDEQASGFYPEDAERFAIRYVDVSATALVTTLPPGEIAPPTAGMLQMERCYTIPDQCSDTLPQQVKQVIDDPSMWDAYHALKARLGDFPDGNILGFHHLLGHPQLVQNDVRVQCEAVSTGLVKGSEWWEPEVRLEYLPDAEDWQLLLQLDTQDGYPPMMWGDNGTLYYMIRRQDFRERRFERSWCVMDCC